MLDMSYVIGADLGLSQSTMCAADLVINPVVGWHYFSPSPQLPSQLLNITGLIMLGDRHVHVNS